MDTYSWNSGEQYNGLHSGLMFPTCKVLWSLSTASLIWICISGNGSLINKIFSSNIFVPLSRLTYSVYLTHVWVIWLYVGSRRERIDTNQSEVFFIFLHNIVIAYFVGFLFSLLFEMPIIKLQKRFIERFLKSEERNLNFGNELNGNVLK
jgi:peptidoglycan/LPS O-acetylase OafA/YrhL